MREKLTSRYLWKKQETNSNVEIPDDTKAGSSQPCEFYLYMPLTNVIPVHTLACVSGMDVTSILGPGQYLISFLFIKLFLIRLVNL